ncbi:MAG: hypothetical protein WBM32_05625 [Crocosphaera sp.]
MGIQAVVTRQQISGNDQILTQFIALDTNNKIELSQVKQNQQSLRVAIPKSATIFLKQGTSYTGQLTTFDVNDLSLTAQDYSQRFSIKDIKQINFSKDDIWIITPEGTRRRLPIRGIPIPIDNIPLTSFRLNDELIEGTINLDQVLTPEQFEKLTKDPKKIRVVKTIIFQDSQTLTIKLISTKR